MFYLRLTFYSDGLVTENKYGHYFLTLGPKQYWSVHLFVMNKPIKSIFLSPKRKKIRRLLYKRKEATLPLLLLQSLHLRKQKTVPQMSKILQYPSIIYLAKIYPLSMSKMAIIHSRQKQCYHLASFKIYSMINKISLYCVNKFGQS